MTREEIAAIYAKEKGCSMYRAIEDLKAFKETVNKCLVHKKSCFGLGLVTISRVPNKHKVSTKTVLLKNGNGKTSEIKYRKYRLVLNVSEKYRKMIDNQIINMEENLDKNT